MLVNITIPTGIGFAIAMKSLYHLGMLQQNSYRTGRYVRWYFQYLGRRKGFIIEWVILIGLGASMIYQIHWLAILILFIYLAGVILRYGLRSSKKKLVITNRVRRLIIGMILLLGLSIFLSEILYVTLLFAGIIMLFPIFVSIVNILFWPMEKMIGNWYVVGARRILSQKPNLKIIGITGSYGKTSTKNFLATILSEQFNVLATPASYNTLMGVTRTIREHLGPIHDVLIVEMGARQKGDIKRLTQLVDPDISIITAIGPQHLETFKTIENVQTTKTEIIEYAKPGVLAIVNGDSELIVSSGIVIEKVNKHVYGVGGEMAGWHANNIEYAAHGMQFDIWDPAGSLFVKAQTKILGEYNIGNILAAVIAAHSLGVPAHKIRRGIRRLKAVPHRLEIIKLKNGATIIDDAFNSNPLGAKMALDVLDRMPGNRKIIVTPGMVELGVRQNELNSEFGKRIAQVADMVVLVGRRQTDPICQGLLGAGYDLGKVQVVGNLSEAAQLVNQNAKDGDVILYENDLPDSYNE